MRATCGTASGTTLLGPLPQKMIFDYLYEDDIDSGPSQSRAYAHLNAILAELDEKMCGAWAVIVRTGKTGDKWAIQLRPWLFRDRREPSDAGADKKAA